MELDITPQKPDENSREYAYRLLRTNIMTLHLPPGASLNEEVLSETLQMSRTPIHEAITTLKEEWLVEVLPQRGTKVSLIDPSLMKEGYYARILLEGSVLKDSAGNLDNGQLEQLLTVLKQQEECAAASPAHRHVSRFIELDDELHHMMYSFGGRSYTWKATRGLISHYDRARYLDALTGNINYDKILTQHREFCDYMLMGLPKGVSAEQKLAEHLTSFRSNSLYTIERYRHYFAL